jgi:hypothetical protein
VSHHDKPFEQHTLPAQHHERHMLQLHMKGNLQSIQWLESAAPDSRLTAALLVRFWGKQMGRRCRRANTTREILMTLLIKKTFCREFEREGDTDEETCARR